MGDIVNLNQFRKRRERELNEMRARRNRVKSGQKAADRKSLHSDIDKRRHELDGKHLDQSPSDE